MKLSLFLTLVTTSLYSEINITEPFIDCLITAESSGNDNALGDKVKGVYKAYGCLQIQQDALTDANEVLGTNYTLTDMFDRSISKEVCYTYLTRYGKSYERKTKRKATFEVLARMWNGGPTGWKRGKVGTKQFKRYNNTTIYWNKVRRIINKCAMR